MPTPPAAPCIEVHRSSYCIPCWEAYCERNPCTRAPGSRGPWGKGRVNYMTLKDEWDRLDSGTRNWFLNNPGCVMVPRTITSLINKNAAENIKCDVHGQMMLSPEDLDFIRHKASRADAAQVSDDVRFFAE
jgi:hypothetical protein